jgi:predicted transcriptional regulator
MEYITFRISKETKDRLEELAMREGKSLSRIIREAANQYAQNSQAAVIYELVKRPERQID